MEPENREEESDERTITLNGITAKPVLTSELENPNPQPLVITLPLERDLEQIFDKIEVPEESELRDQLLNCFNVKEDEDWSTHMENVTNEQQSINFSRAKNEFFSEMKITSSTNEFKYMYIFFTNRNREVLKELIADKFEAFYQNDEQDYFLISQLQLINLENICQFLNSEQKKLRSSDLKEQIFYFFNILSTLKLEGLLHTGFSASKIIYRENEGKLRPIIGDYYLTIKFSEFEHLLMDRNEPTDKSKLFKLQGESLIAILNDFLKASGNFDSNALQAFLINVLEETHSKEINCQELKEIIEMKFNFESLGDTVPLTEIYHELRVRYFEQKNFFLDFFGTFDFTYEHRLAFLRNLIRGQEDGHFSIGQRRIIFEIAVILSEQGNLFGAIVELKKIKEYQSDFLKALKKDAFNNFPHLPKAGYFYVKSLLYLQEVKLLKDFLNQPPNTSENDYLDIARAKLMVRECKYIEALEIYNLKLLKYEKDGTKLLLQTECTIDIAKSYFKQGKLLESNQHLKKYLNDSKCFFYIPETMKAEMYLLKARILKKKGLNLKRRYKKAELVLKSAKNIEVPDVILRAEIIYELAKINYELAKRTTISKYKNFACYDSILIFLNDNREFIKNSTKILNIVIAIWKKFKRRGESVNSFESIFQACGLANKFKDSLPDFKVSKHFIKVENEVQYLEISSKLNESVNAFEAELIKFEYKWVKFECKQRKGPNLTNFLKGRLKHLTEDLKFDETAGLFLKYKYLELYQLYQNVDRPISFSDFDNYFYSFGYEGLFDLRENKCKKIGKICLFVKSSSVYFKSLKLLLKFLLDWRLFYEAIIIIDRILLIDEGKKEILLKSKEEFSPAELSGLYVETYFNSNSERGFTKFFQAKFFHEEEQVKKQDSKPISSRKYYLSKGEIELFDSLACLNEKKGDYSQNIRNLAMYQARKYPDSRLAYLVYAKFLKLKNQKLEAKDNSSSVEIIAILLDLIELSISLDDISGFKKVVSNFFLLVHSPQFYESRSIIIKILWMRLTVSSHYYNKIGIINITEDYNNFFVQRRKTYEVRPNKRPAIHILTGKIMTYLIRSFSKNVLLNAFGNSEFINIKWLLLFNELRICMKDFVVRLDEEDKDPEDKRPDLKAKIAEIKKILLIEKNYTPLNVLEEREIWKASRSFLEESYGLNIYQNEENTSIEDGSKFEIENRLLQEEIKKGCLDKARKEFDKLHYIAQKYFCVRDKRFEIFASFLKNSERPLDIKHNIRLSRFHDALKQYASDLKNLNQKNINHSLATFDAYLELLREQLSFCRTFIHEEICDTLEKIGELYNSFEIQLVYEKGEYAKKILGNVVGILKEQNLNWEAGKFSNYINELINVLPEKKERLEALKNKNPDAEFFKYFREISEEYHSNVLKIYHTYDIFKLIRNIREKLLERNIGNKDINQSKWDYYEKKREQQKEDCKKFWRLGYMYQDGFMNEGGQLKNFFNYNKIQVFPQEEYLTRGSFEKDYREINNFPFERIL